MVRLSDGVAAPRMPARPAPITAPRVALHYDSPQVSTQSAATQQWTPPAGTNRSPITVPSFQAQYNPQPTYSAPAPVWQAPYDPGAGGGGMAGGNAGINQAQAAPAPPPPPPPPVVGGAEWFSKLGAGAKEAERSKWLGGDSDYTAQIGEYDRALQSFIDRITKQKSLFDTDSAESVQATTRNEDQSMNNLAEDFGARGLSFSGLQDQEMGKGRQRFAETRTNITKNRDRQKMDADNRQKDYSAENQTGRGNARRAALQRMSADQMLKDANAF